MKTRDIFLITLLFIFSALVTAEIVTYQLTGNHLFTQRQALATLPEKGSACSDTPMTQRPLTNDPQLKIVSEYEKACNSAFLDSLMIFSDMPISIKSAEDKADKMALRLKEFDAHDLQPIVIMEPDSEWGLIDFHEYAAGDYDAWIDAYFKRLKANGISDKMVGLWIPFPEPQHTTWNNSSADDFALSINRHFSTMKKYFPTAEKGILLDSQAGADEQKEQLLAYVRLIDEGLVDTVGLQGFPWNPADPTDIREPLTTASEFLPSSPIKEVAKALNVQSILINTGTYRHKKMDNGGNLAIPFQQRSQTLQTIADQVIELKKDNYSVMVNLFAENKIDTKEGVDWSYWNKGEYKTSQQTALFVNFVLNLKQNDIDIGLYDAR